MCCAPGARILAAATLLLDALKGAAAVLIVAYSQPGIPPLFAAAGAFFGHLFPVWLKFKGGKGVATFLGTLIALDWRAGLAFIALWLLCALRDALFFCRRACRQRLDAGRPGFAASDRRRAALYASGRCALVHASRQYHAPRQRNRDEDRTALMANVEELRLSDEQRFDWLRLLRSESVGPRGTISAFWSIATAARARRSRPCRALQDAGARCASRRKMRSRAKWRRPRAAARASSPSANPITRRCCGGSTARRR